MLRPILVGVLLPIVAGLVIALAGPRLRAIRCAVLARIGWEGAALLVFFAILQFGLLGWLGFPPHDVKLWPPFLALAALPLTVDPPAPLRWVRALLTALWVVAACILLLRPGLTMHWSVREGALWLGVAGSGWLTTLAAWPWAAARATPGAALTALVMASGSSMAAILLFGSFTYAQLVGLIAFPTAVVAVLGWWRAASTAAAATLALALALVLPMWWLLATTMSDLPHWAPALLALSGAAGALAALPPLRDGAPWKRIVCIALAAGALAAPVLVWGAVTAVRMNANAGADGY